jgi:peptide/nickel transport system permease protein
MCMKLVKPVFRIVPTLVLAFTAVFFLVRLIPGDSVTLLLENGQYSQQEADALRGRLGLDQPIPVQYARFILQVVTGDLGHSIWTGRPVFDELFRHRLPVTLELTALAAIFGALIGIPVGVVAAIRQDTVVDYGLRGVSVGAQAIPGFWLATLVLVLPSYWWGWAPPFGFKSLNADPAVHLQQILLPALLMSISLAAALMRMTRSMVLEVLRQDYVRTATAKGLQRRVVIVRHCLRNAMIPLVSIIGVQLALLLGGTVVFETIFSIPGVGSYLFDGVSRRDYPVVQGVAVMLTVGVVMINALVDMSYRLIDPRIRR